MQTGEIMTWEEIEAAKSRVGAVHEPLFMTGVRHDNSSSALNNPGGEDHENSYQGLFEEDEYHMSPGLEDRDFVWHGNTKVRVADAFHASGHPGLAGWENV